MKKVPTTTLVSLIMALCLVAAASPAEAQRKLYSISTADDQLRVINPSTGATVSSVTITLPGKTVFWGNGLARDPITGKLWALLTISGQNERQLVTINPVTGLATSVGNTGDNFAGLAFISNGTLYAVSGERAAVPGALYFLSTSNGSSSFVTALGHADSGGQTIAFNPTNGLLYHASGFSKQIFESINPQTFEITNIPLSGFASTQTSALTFSPSDGVFLMGDFAGFLSGNANFIRLTPGGFATLVGPMDHPSKGLAFMPVTPLDFDGDGKTDIGIYRDGAWSISRSSDGGQTVVGWGGVQDTAVPADYDGDGKTDIAVYLDGTWSILRSSDGGSTAVGWGGPQDIPVPADYDGDGKADIAIYRGGAWSIKRSSDGGNTVMGWGGAPQDILVPADYDGDGKTDIAIYRDGTWSILRSSDGGNTVVGWGGLPQDIPVPADYDGDGKTDIAIYRDGTWSILRSSDGGNTVVGWGGAAQDIPIPADYDGDGKADVAVYRNGTWFIKRSSDGGLTVVGWGGAPNDIPLN